MEAQQLPGEGREGGQRPADEASLWAALASATGTADFCRAWLDLQCARTPGASGGLILLEDGVQSYAPLAAWPARPSNIDPLRTAGEAALASGQPQIHPLEGEADKTCIAYPVSSSEAVHGVIVLAFAKVSSAEIQPILRQLHWGVGWIVSLVWQHRADQRAMGGASAAAAMELLAGVQEHDRLEKSSMALCNEVCRIMGADRAAVGLLHKDAAKLTAMSHGSWFRKRSDIAETLESAMDEAHDQRATILVPDLEENAVGPITIQHARLSGTLGSASIISVPLTDRGIPLGVLLVERDKGAEPFGAGDVLFCETAASLIAPTLALQKREARLFSGRIRGKAMDGAKALFGPRRPLAKALGVTALILLLIMFIPLAQFRVSADAALEGRVQRAASAPYQGFIANSHARAGDIVEAGQVLASLDDRDLVLDSARAQSEVQQYERRYRQALANHERAEMNLFGAQLRQAESELQLIDYKLERVNIVAPIAGVVVSGDVSQLVGSPVEEGELLFEVAPMDDFRVVLNVAEADISYVEPGQAGRFAPTGLAGRTVPFTITNLTSVTDNVDGLNTFRIEAELGEGAQEILRPGMEGVAKVDIDRRGNFWIWTRGLREWLSLFLWKWVP